MVPPAPHMHTTGGLPLLLRPRLARELWLGVMSLNHRFDKLGRSLPLELHGCGCSLCARQQRSAHQYWEAR
jgi:hypothetical protein